MSDIRANTISDTSGNGPINLTGQVAATTTIRMHSDATYLNNFSFNVSTTDDEGTGIKKVNFSSGYINSGYAVTATVLASANNSRTCMVSGPATSSITVYTWQDGGNAANTSSSLSINGDLA